MDLFYVLLNPDEFSSPSLIYAELPWTLQSKAIMIEASPSPRPILNIDHIEYGFFLEFTLARQLIHLYSKQNLCLVDTYQRIIEFALNQQNH